MAGSNHTLPTEGAARFASGLNVRHFRRRMAEVRLNDRDPRWRVPECRSRRPRASSGTPPRWHCVRIPGRDAHRDHHRKTGETDVALTLGLDGSGRGTRTTGVGFLDHMLDLLARHGRLDLDVR